MVNCRKYTIYLHKAEIIPLQWYEKVLMQYHYMICKLCKKYTIENERLNEYLQKNIEEVLGITDEEAEFQKQELLKKLKL